MAADLKSEVSASLSESAALLSKVSEDPDPIVRAIGAVEKAFSSGRKMLIAGNGGSAADAQHMAAELVHRFKRDRRKALPAIALTTNTSVLTAVANDWDYSEVFSRQVEALGAKGDVLLVLSTSGESKNLVAAVSQAKSQGIYCIGLLGRGGGRLKGMVDLAIVVPHSSTPRIQEAHQCICHIICEQVEKRF